MNNNLFEFIYYNLGIEILFLEEGKKQVPTVDATLDELMSFARDLPTMKKLSSEQERRLKSLMVESA